MPQRIENGLNTTKNNVLIYPMRIIGPIIIDIKILGIKKLNEKKLDE